MLETHYVYSPQLVFIQRSEWERMSQQAIPGTPSNLGMTFLETNRIEVITGVNLPMLLKLASLRTSEDLLAVAREMRDHGRGAIWVASDLLRGQKGPT